MLQEGERGSEGGWAWGGHKMCSLDKKREEEKRKEGIRCGTAHKINSVEVGYFGASFPGKHNCQILALTGVM